MSVSAENGSALIGTPKEFEDTADDWIEYIERLEHFFDANGIAEEAKKKSILLSSCGSKTYKLFRNLLAPTRPGDATWTVLKQTMGNHQSPKPSVIAERFKFNKRDRKPGESVPIYMAELRRLSEHCEFDANLDDMLRDRLVCGMQGMKIQQKLLSETTLNLNNAFKISSGESPKRFFANTK